MLRNFVKLDILTALAGISSRSTFTRYIGLLVIIFFFGLFMQTIVPAVFIGMQFVLMTLHLPFRGEHRNMNSLYVLLDVSRRNVVRGRYIYVFAALGCGVILGFTVAVFGFLAERALDMHIGALASLHFVLALFFMQVIAQSATLPTLFMHGKGKLGTFNFLPQILTVLGAFAVTRALSTESGVEMLSEFAKNPQLVGIVLFTVLFLAVLAVFLSYRVSYRLYCKREF